MSEELKPDASDEKLAPEDTAAKDAAAQDAASPMPTPIPIVRC